tara:strand:- start:291 stop:971 length:681 start_codon:yes stop_codon:yes gene_type:complete
MSNKKKYSINSIFGPTIQGEGALIGTPCMFLRFASCNLWDGKEQHRSLSVCKICDTDFSKQFNMTADEIAEKLQEYKGVVDWLIITGGEPLLQLDDFLLGKLHGDWKINLETNGTLPLPPMKYNYTKLHCYMGKNKFDHISFSPKTPPEQLGIDFIDRVECDSLKILFPDDMGLLEHYLDFPATQKFLQPIEKDGQVNWSAVVKKLFELGGDWRLSPQLHKLIGVE